ncbi:MAG: exosortase A [Burkholderiaceae bacterium]|nr:exosortase A [Burkholderiaceae bacterium]
MASPPLPLGPTPGPDPAGAPGARWSERPDMRVFATFALACALSIAVFPDVWASMVRVWLGSETFAHGFLALPCAAWMLWRRREDWSAMPQRVWWPGIAAFAGCGMLWLAGNLGGVASLEQLGAVGMIPSTMLLLAGPRVTRALAFPLAFLFFAVPVGEFLTPILMDYTADATVTALRWTGIPVFREGLHFTLPTGRWSVVEACSGLRYLIASLALGVLYAYLQFRTLKYRLALVALALVVPIVANWIRAYGIVLLGHVSNMKLAAGADHLIYGWVFFGVVMALLFWIGSLWREPPAPEHENEFATGVRETSASPRSNGPVLAGIAVAVVAALLWRPLSAGLLDATHPVDAVASLRTATEAFPPAPALDFEPHFTNATGTLRSARLVEDVPVELHAFYYARQHESGEMIHSGNWVVRVDDFRSPIVWQGTQQTPWGTVAAYRIGRPEGNELLVWRWYAVSDLQTASAYRAKAATAWSLVTGRGDHSLAVVLATPLDTSDARTKTEAIQSAQRRLAAFARGLQPAIEAIAHGRR